MRRQETLQHETDDQRKDREIRLYYALTVILGIVFWVAALKIHPPAVDGAPYSTVKTFCDAFFVSGLLLFSLWLIAWGWYHGVLDIFLYAASLMLSAFQKEPDEHSKEKRDFVTYREHKKLERRAPTHLLIVGSAFLALSLLLYILLAFL